MGTLLLGGSALILGGASVSLTIPAGAVPDAFTSGMWSLADAATDGTLNVTITSLPANNGGVITDVEYRVDSGTWTSSGGITDFSISSLTNATEYDVDLRAVNSYGNSAAGDLKSATPTLVSVDYTVTSTAELESMLESGSLALGEVIGIQNGTYSGVTITRSAPPTGSWSGSNYVRLSLIPAIARC